MSARVTSNYAENANGKHLLVYGQQYSFSEQLDNGWSFVLRCTLLSDALTPKKSYFLVQKNKYKLKIFIINICSFYASILMPIDREETLGTDCLSAC